MMSYSTPTGWNQLLRCSRKGKQMDLKSERYRHVRMWIASLFSGTDTHVCTTWAQESSSSPEKPLRSSCELSEPIGGRTTFVYSLNSPESIYVHTRLSGATISSSLPTGDGKPSSPATD